MTDTRSLDERVDRLRIPSVSAGAREEAALREAAEWGARRVRAAGGAHAPDEAFRVASLRAGARAARALSEELAGLR